MHQRPSGSSPRLRAGCSCPGWKEIGPEGGHERHAPLRMARIIEESRNDVKTRRQSLARRLDTRNKGKEHDSLPARCILGGGLAHRPPCPPPFVRLIATDAQSCSHGGAARKSQRVAARLKANGGNPVEPSTDSWLPSDHQGPARSQERGPYVHMGKVGSGFNDIGGPNNRLTAARRRLCIQDA